MKKRPPTAPKLLAKFILDKTTAAPEPPATPMAEKNPAATALGRLGVLKGVKARAESLTAEERTEIVKKGTSARWKSKVAPDDTD